MAITGSTLNTARKSLCYTLSMASLLLFSVFVWAINRLYPRKTSLVIMPIPAISVTTTPHTNSAKLSISIPTKIRTKSQDTWNPQAHKNTLFLCNVWTTQKPQGNTQNKTRKCCDQKIILATHYQPFCKSN